MKQSKIVDWRRITLLTPKVTGAMILSLIVCTPRGTCTLSRRCSLFFRFLRLRLLPRRPPCPLPGVMRGGNPRRPPARRLLPPPPGFSTPSPEVESDRAPGSPSRSHEVEAVGTPPPPWLATLPLRRARRQPHPSPLPPFARPALLPPRPLPLPRAHPSPPELLSWPRPPSPRPPLHRRLA